MLEHEHATHQPTNSVRTLIIIEPLTTIGKKTSDGKTIKQEINDITVERALTIPSRALTIKTRIVDANVAILGNSCQSLPVLGLDLGGMKAGLYIAVHGLNPFLKTWSLAVTTYLVVLKTVSLSTLTLYKLWGLKSGWNLESLKTRNCYFRVRFFVACGSFIFFISEWRHGPTHRGCHGQEEAHQGPPGIQLQQEHPE